MNDDVIIDALTVSDVEGALAIDVAAFAGAPEVREAQLREELVRPWARLRAARSGDRLTGYALFWHVADELHLLNVAVASSERRRGLGRALMEDMFAYAKANAVVKVLLEVRAGNAPAIGLYRSLGFVDLGTRKAYYADGEDALEMIREFVSGTVIG